MLCLPSTSSSINCYRCFVVPRTDNGFELLFKVSAKPVGLERDLKMQLQKGRQVDAAYLHLVIDNIPHGRDTRGYLIRIILYFNLIYPLYEDRHLVIHIFAKPRESLRPAAAIYTHECNVVAGIRLNR